MKPKIELRVIALLVVRSLEKIFLVIFMLGFGFVEFNGVLKLEMVRIFVLLFLVE
ncbi:hypothetical protein HpBGD77_21540 [Helicobacter pylori]